MSATHPGFAWTCAVCGGMASTVVLVEPGALDPRTRSADAPPGTESILDDQHRISIAGGPVSVTTTVASEQAAAARTAVEVGDAGALFAIDREFAPFWCPDCADS